MGNTNLWMATLKANNTEPETIKMVALILWREKLWRNTAQTERTLSQTITQTITITVTGLSPLSILSCFLNSVDYETVLPVCRCLRVFILRQGGNLNFS